MFRCIRRLAAKHAATGVVLAGDLSFNPNSGLYRLMTTGLLSMTSTDRNELSRRELSQTTNALRDYDTIEEKLLAEEHKLEPMRDNFAALVNSVEIGASDNTMFPIMGR